MIGLTRAFIYAGANSVVVSLWNVNDGATAELMKTFYQNLNRGLPKDEALREAKLTLINGSQRLWSHPYFWAPFVLLGNRNAISKVTLDVP
jgi:CHAT domain-containing protein